MSLSKHLTHYCIIVAVLCKWYGNGKGNIYHRYFVCFLKWWLTFTDICQATKTKQFISLFRTNLTSLILDPVCPMLKGISLNPMIPIRHQEQSPYHKLSIAEVINETQFSVRCVRDFYHNVQGYVSNDRNVFSAAKCFNMEKYGTIGDCMFARSFNLDPFSPFSQTITRTTFQSASKLIQLSFSWWISCPLITVRPG